MGEQHGSFASSELVAEARAFKNTIRNQLKKQRLKANKAKRGVAALRAALDGGTDVSALEVAIQAAEHLVDETTSELGTLLSAARGRLQFARLEQIAAQKNASLETAEEEFVALALSHNGARADPDRSPGSMAVEPPHGSVCPITDELMLDPVMCSDGHSCERLSIEHWLREHNTSPLTGAELEHTHLVANHALRKMIQEWKELHSI